MIYPNPFKNFSNPFKKKEVVKQQEMSASYTYGSSITPVFVQNYDGEKNLGEIGPIIEHVPNYYALSKRSWQAYTTSEIAKIVIDKYVCWVIDKGLKLQSNPQKKVLEREGIKIDSEKFNEQVESLFSVWGKSTNSSYNGMDNLHSLSKEGFKNSRLGGDNLIVLSFDGTLKVQVIDGCLIYSMFDVKVENGNKIRNGIETDSKGKHVAYHLFINGENKRIAAFNSIGLRTAFLVYGSKHRLSDNRGMPKIAIALESIKKMERYREAAIGSAEERQKIPYAIEHEAYSDGTSPLEQNIAWAQDIDQSGKNIPVDAVGNRLAQTVAATTNKQVFNMTQGAKIKSLESKQEMFFKEFHSTNADIICAAVEIPPNIAFSIYNDSFSASRAATKDWDHTIDVTRDDYSFQFYQPIYNYFLHVNILMGKIDAPGYLEAFAKKNWIVVEAYRNCRFTGPFFPHIDPLKEVNAERAKLGELAKHLPLTTLEQATEALNGGDSIANVEQFAKELDDAKTEGLEAVPVGVPISDPAKSKDDEDEK